MGISKGRPVATVVAIACAWREVQRKPRKNQQEMDFFRIQLWDRGSLREHRGGCARWIFCPRLLAWGKRDVSRVHQVVDTRQRRGNGGLREGRKQDSTIASQLKVSSHKVLIPAYYPGSWALALVKCFQASRTFLSQRHLSAMERLSISAWVVNSIKMQSNGGEKSAKPVWNLAETRALRAECLLASVAPWGLQKCVLQ